MSKFSYQNNPRSSIVEIEAEMQVLAKGELSTHRLINMSTNTTRSSIRINAEMHKKLRNELATQRSGFSRAQVRYLLDQNSFQPGKATTFRKTAKHLAVFTMLVMSFSAVSGMQGKGPGKGGHNSSANPEGQLQPEGHGQWPLPHNPRYGEHAIEHQENDLVQPGNNIETCPCCGDEFRWLAVDNEKSGRILVPQHHQIKQNGPFMELKKALDEEAGSGSAATKMKLSHQRKTNDGGDAIVKNWFGFGKEVNMGKRNQCPSCGAYVYKKGDGNLVSTWEDKESFRNAGIAFGAIFMGLGLGCYIDTLRTAGQSIQSSYGGHLFLVMGMLILAFFLFRGNAWFNDHQTDWWIKAVGVSAWCAGGGLIVGALSQINAMPDGVAEGDFIADIKWTSLVSDPKIAFVLAGGCSLLAISIIFMLAIHFLGRGMKGWDIVKTLAVGAGHALGLCCTVAAGAVGIDLMTQVLADPAKVVNLPATTVESLTVESLTVESLQLVDFSAFIALMGAAMIWVMYLFLSQIIKGFDVQSKEFWCAAGSMTFAGIGGSMFATGLQNWHHHIVNKALGDNNIDITKLTLDGKPLEGGIPEAYSALWLGALAFVLVALSLAIKAKGWGCTKGAAPAGP